MVAKIGLQKLVTGAMSSEQCQVLAPEFEFAGYHLIGCCQNIVTSLFIIIYIAHAHCQDSQDVSLVIAWILILLDCPFSRGGIPGWQKGLECKRRWRNLLDWNQGLYLGLNNAHHCGVVSVPDSGRGVWYRD